jgi:maleate isomerase
LGTRERDSRRIRKPVVAVNTATYWLALRRHGITDRLDGHGVLLTRH